MADSVETTPADDADLSLFIQQFTDASDGTLTARADSERCRDYFDGKQWTSDEEKKIKKRGQPVITDNRIKDKVEAWLGAELATRTDPKAYPRTPQEEGAADAATDALRYICDANRFPQLKSGVFENMLVEGTGACEIIVEQVRGKPQIKLRRIRWDRLYFDPHSMLADFSDARYLGIVVWMDIEEAKKKDPEHAIAYDQMIDGTFDWGGTYDDKPNLWIDRNRKRVQILEHYYNKDGWKRVVFSRAGLIEKPAPSAYVDENGEPECCLKFQSAYVGRDGSRYGVVPRYVPLQDEINHRRSKALHLLNARQTIGEKGGVADVPAMKREMAKPDGHVEVTPGMRFEVSQTNDLALGQFQILADTLQSLSASGPNSAMQGQESKQSGRAQQVAQQAGTLQLGPVMDNLRHWQHRVMVGCWNRVKQFWTEETWIRVTDNENTKFVALNQKLTRGELAIKKAREQGATPEQLQQLVQQMAQDPAGMQEVVINGTAEMDVDIVIDEAPDTVTLQSEQWLQLTELAKNGIPIKPETLIKASNLRNKDELIDDIKEQEKQGGIPPQVQEQLQKVQDMLQKKGEELQAKEQQLQQAEQQLSQQAQQKGAALQQQELDIQKQQAELDSSAKIYKAEIDAARTIFAAEQKVAASQMNSDHKMHMMDEQMAAKKASMSKDSKEAKAS